MNTNAGTWIGGFIGFVAGIVFIAVSIFTEASQVPPPPFLVIIFAVFGAVIGHGIGEVIQGRRKRRGP